ncbi:MAG: cytochrome c [Sideroxydans sp.]|nr:cytochrome c [Sideroxydans sp.]NOT99780.1 cytochrome c [Sideroxydans sp.]
MVRQSWRFACVFLLLLGFVGVAQAEMTREEYAIKFRKSSYSVLGWYYGSMHRVIKGINPYDQAAFLRDAERVAFLSKLPKDGFIAGTETGDTKAKPEIWTKTELFKEDNDRLESEAAKLAEVAKGGDFNLIKEQFGKVQKACKTCHDDFVKRKTE